MARIYVASSWRNTLQPGVVAAPVVTVTRSHDFRNPAPGVKGFAWSERLIRRQQWTADGYRKSLYHPLAVDGYAHDMGAMQWRITFSSCRDGLRTFELGDGGRGKRTIVLHTRRRRTGIDGEDGDQRFPGVSLDEVRAFRLLRPCNRRASGLTRNEAGMRAMATALRDGSHFLASNVSASRTGSRGP